MLDWLIPISLFWIVAAIYLGALPVSISGGTGLRQSLGLLLTYVLYLGVWGVLHRVLGEGTTMRVIVPTAIATLLIPLLVRVAFALFGVRVGRAGAH